MTELLLAVAIVFVGVGLRGGLFEIADALRELAEILGSLKVEEVDDGQ